MDCRRYHNCHGGAVAIDDIEADIKYLIYPTETNAHMISDD